MTDCKRERQRAELEVQRWRLIFQVALCWDSQKRWGKERAPQGAISIKMTYSTDKARIVPAVAQGLQKPIPGINLKVTAVAFRAKHLLVVWGERTVKEAEAVSGTDTVLQVAIRLK